MKAIRLAVAFQACLLAGWALAEEDAPAAEAPATVSAPVPVAAPTPVSAPGARQHRGVHVHLEGGIGAMDSETSGGGPGIRFSGPGGFFAVAVGGAVGGRLIVGGEAWSAGAYQPDVTQDSTTTTGMHQSAVAVAGVGPTIRLYIAPESANMFLSLTPSMTWLGWFRNVNDEPIHSTARVGVGARFAIGKEWWVGSSWGLGISGSLLFSSNEDYGSNPASWHTLAGSVNFSASFH